MVFETIDNPPTSEGAAEVDDTAEEPPEDTAEDAALKTSEDADVDDTAES